MIDLVKEAREKIAAAIQTVSERIDDTLGAGDTDVAVVHALNALHEVRSLTSTLADRLEAAERENNLLHQQLAKANDDARIDREMRDAHTARADVAEARVKALEGALPDLTPEVMKRALGWREYDSADGLTGEANMIDRVYHAIRSAFRDLAALQQGPEDAGYVPTHECVQEIEKIERNLEEGAARVIARNQPLGQQGETA